MTIAPGERHWEIFQRLCREANAKGNLVADAYLAALAFETGAAIFYQEAAQYFVKASQRLPYFAKIGEVGASPHGSFISCTESQAQILVALQSNTIFYLWYHAVSDCDHVSDAIVQAFPCPRSVLPD
ncbi:MAG: hypothetical protein H8K07_07485 [Nitrospira sp.]|nr:hypothetical protein [Nitrospira sp.]